jgi:hypothetical protein
LCIQIDVETFILTKSKTAAKTVPESETSAATTVLNSKTAVKTVPKSGTSAETAEADDGKEKCSVCQENYEEGDRIQRVFPCKVSFL